MSVQLEEEHYILFACETKLYTSVAQLTGTRFFRLDPFTANKGAININMRLSPLYYALLM